ncbi:MAG TPA: TerC family protein [Deltaproteobacteria bacterium]|nr:TerC family protein [Deltaproteobacteria bacterium]
MPFWWIAFTILILGLLALDLGVFNRKAHVIHLKEALLWTSFWVSLGLLFGVGIYYFHGHHKAMEYFAGYLIEYSLSVDNLFVFLLIFQYFQVPHKLEHKALFWGILMALITRAIFIFAGVALINKFHWIIYIFGVFLIFTAARMALGKGHEIHPGKNILVRLLRKIMPVTRNYQEGHFFVVKRGVRFATPLLAVILALETTDIIFAVDSIPAVLAITKDQFIIYTSNVFAILGLRSMFFAISGIMRIFHYLQYGLVAVLSFVGVKMLISDFYKIPINISLGLIAGFLAISIIASLIWPKPMEEPAIKAK